MVAFQRASVYRPELPCSIMDLDLSCLDWHAEFELPSSCIWARRSRLSPQQQPRTTTKIIKVNKIVRIVRIERMQRTESKKQGFRLLSGIFAKISQFEKNHFETSVERCSGCSWVPWYNSLRNTTLRCKATLIFVNFREGGTLIILFLSTWIW
jgi:hypothetical protein